MSTKSLSYENSFNIIRNISQNIARIDSNSTENLFEDTIEYISKNVDCNVCAVYEANAAGAYNLVKAYGQKCMPFIKDVFRRTGEIAADAMLRLKTNYLDLETSDFIYYVPIKSQNPTCLMIFSFKKQLSVKGIEMLEAISDILATAVDKLALKQQLREQRLRTIKSLVVAIEAKDVYTQGHSQRVAQYAKSIGKYLNMDENQLNELEITGLVHDIGKIGISDSVLTKPDRLTEEEFDTIKLHPQIGMKILNPLGVSENVMMGTLFHHKRYDLTGYPKNLDIDKLPLVSAIIGVADAYDAMTTVRIYKEKMSRKAALVEMQRNSGTQFHPAIVDVMTELIKDNSI